MSETYRVTGMTCDGCVRAVTNAIRARAPAAKIDVDLKAGKVRVDGADTASVTAAIQEAGFGFGGRV